MKKYINFVKSLTCIALVLLSSVGFAQNLTKIKDATVTGTSAVATPGAILELESNNKGFLVPRMTTAQRDAILPANRTDGLLIYNKDTGCFNHWSSSQIAWLSICGTPPPAVFSISTAQCNAIIVNGIYTQGSPLTAGNYLTIPVTVTQAGNYTISGSTINGYYFEKSGNFPSPGNYTLNLPGTGTPNNATATPGDPVTISLNGIANVCSPKIPIVPAAVSYTIACNTAAVQGNYLIGIPLNSDNKIVLNVDATSTGFWSINTGANPVNGMKFSGTGTFSTTGPQTIELLGTGTPLASGVNNFPLISNSTPDASCAGIPVTVSSVAYTMNCGTATVNGSYMQNVTLGSSNTITLPINVTATGKTTITTNTVNGITFTSGEVDLSSLGNQTITLIGSGTPTGFGVASVTLSGAPGAAGSCAVNVTINPQPVTYTLSCGTIAVNGTYRPNVALTAANNITLTVNATYGGAYNISTNTVDGIAFSGTGTLAVGTNTITLQGSGTPISAGTKSFTISTNSSGTATTCNVSVPVLYRPMVILGAGGGTYQPGSASDVQTSKAVLLSENNFGLLTNSKVKIPKFVVQANATTTTSALINGATPSATQLTNYINNNKVDIIVIGYSWAPTAAERAILIDFIRNKNGVVLNFSENTAASESLANELYGITTITRTIANGGGATYLMNDIVDPIMRGPFGQVGGQYWGEDASGTDHLANLPASAIIYSRGNGATTGSSTSLVTMFRHNTLGYFWNGDGGFLAGDRTNASITIWPSKNDASSNPIPKSPYGVAGYGGTGKTVYNSLLYANALAWAIEYVQQKKP